MKLVGWSQKYNSYKVLLLGVGLGVSATNFHAELRLGVARIEFLLVRGLVQVCFITWWSSTGARLLWKHGKGGTYAG